MSGHGAHGREGDPAESLTDRASTGVAPRPLEASESSELLCICISSVSKLKSVVGCGSHGSADGCCRSSACIAT